MRIYPHVSEYDVDSWLVFMILFYLSRAWGHGMICIQARTQINSSGGNRVVEGIVLGYNIQYIDTFENHCLPRLILGDPRSGLGG